MTAERRVPGRRAPLARRAGRAAALAATATVLLATTVALEPPAALDAATTCGPAGRIVLEDPREGCGGDPTIEVLGGPEAGLPRHAEATSRRPYEYVLAGDVTIPGAIPAVTVHRVCRVSPEVNGVRSIACEGDAPEAACGGTLTAVTEGP